MNRSTRETIRRPCGACHFDGERVACESCQDGRRAYLLHRQLHRTLLNLIPPIKPLRRICDIPEEDLNNA